MGDVEHQHQGMAGCCSEAGSYCLYLYEVQHCYLALLLYLFFKGETGVQVPTKVFDQIALLYGGFAKVEVQCVCMLKHLSRAKHYELGLLAVEFELH